MAAPPTASVPASHTPAGVWRVPLVGAALAVTAGIVLDRYLSLPLFLTLLATGCSLVVGVVMLAMRLERFALVSLLLTGVAVGAAYHHYRHDWFPPDNIGNLADETPLLVELRGVIDEEPLHSAAVKNDPLRSRDRGELTMLVLRATQIRRDGAWVDVSGRVQLVTPGTPDDLHVGDELEAVGHLSAIQGPANPGEFDWAGYLRDQGIRSRLVVRKTADGVTRLERGWPESTPGWLAVLRGWGQQSLGRTLPPRTGGLAMALLLGEGSTMTAADWDKYMRTGVIHVLAISGQHLVVLGLFLWWAMRLLRVRQRHAAWTIALFLFGYALLTGGRPPAMRSAFTVGAVTAGVVLRRRVLPANALALSWLAVALLNPMDLFGAGCQLSFLSVAILYWGTRWGSPRADDPLERLIEESRPAWLRALRGAGRWLGANYAISLLIWLAVTPLAAARYHVVAPCGAVLGPPLTLLTSVALLAGFMQLAAAAVWEPLATPFAWVVHYSLAGCEGLVDLAERFPGAYFHVGDVPEWWLWIFYLALLLFLSNPALRVHWRWAVPAGLGWLCAGLALATVRLPADELRCTFLAVGHGGCIVLETPDGRTLLYDAGAIGGPDCARRQIAPFLWHRGVRRIDEVFLSHGDLDHFNGLTSLLDRFPVAQVTCTPTFAQKDTPGVRATLAELERRGVPVRVVSAGDRLQAGDVTVEVLHPPPSGPPGNENARSMVLALRHAERTLLLTGDLEGAGLQQVLDQSPRRADVLLAPHHGSPRANTARLADWARPRVVVAALGPGDSLAARPAYQKVGAQFLSTWPHGAVTVRTRRGGMVVETFATKERFVFRGAARNEKAAARPAWYNWQLAEAPPERIEAWPRNTSSSPYSPCRWRRRSRAGGCGQRASPLP
jgi:competence protein ComEC